MYAGREEVLLNEVGELVMHFIVNCDYDYSVYAAKSVAYGKGQIADVGCF